MLKALRPDQAHFVAVLAKTARMQRDVFLGSVREEAFDPRPRMANTIRPPLCALESTLLVD
jgi:hypothetical protein